METRGSLFWCSMGYRCPFRRPNSYLHQSGAHITATPKEKHRLRLYWNVPASYEAPFFLHGIKLVTSGSISPLSPAQFSKELLPPNLLMVDPHDQAYLDFQEKDSQYVTPYNLIDQPLPNYYDAYTWSPDEGDSLGGPNTSSSPTKLWAQTLAVSYRLDKNAWEYQTDTEWIEFIQWINVLGPPSEGEVDITKYRNVTLPRRDTPIGINNINSEADVVQLTQAFQTEVALSVMRYYSVFPNMKLSFSPPKVKLCTGNENPVPDPPLHSIRTDILFKFSELKDAQVTPDPDARNQTRFQKRQLNDLEKAIELVFSRAFQDVLPLKNKDQHELTKTVLCVEVKKFGFIVPSQIQRLANDAILLTGPNMKVKGRSPHAGTRAILQQAFRYAFTCGHQFIAVVDWQSILILDLGMSELSTRVVRWAVVGSEDATKALSYLLFRALKAIKASITDGVAELQNAARESEVDKSLGALNLGIKH